MPEVMKFTCDIHAIMLCADVISSSLSGIVKNLSICQPYPCLDRERGLHLSIPSGFASDTIHSAFRYPVDPNERPQINWDLANYDLIVIDELSMVPSHVFDHILTTLQELHVRPVVLLCGDQQQQEPIATIEGKTRPTTGVLQNKALYKNSVVVNFIHQHRYVDPAFQEILNAIRYYKPSR